jgi:hypothetical protein
MCAKRLALTKDLLEARRDNASGCERNSPLPSRAVSDELEIAFFTAHLVTARVCQWLQTGDRERQEHARDINGAGGEPVDAEGAWQDHLWGSHVGLEKDRGGCRNLANIGNLT